MHDAVGLKLNSPSDYPGIEQYFDEQYNESEKEELDKIRLMALSETPMDPECKVVFNIPTRYSETHLDQTLELYLEQTAIKENIDFEVVVLINSPTVDSKTGQSITDEDIRETQAFKHALAFQQNHKNPKISILIHRYQPEDLNIGRIRKHLAGYTLKRAVKSGHNDPENLLIVTQDADMQSINPSYVEKLSQMFQENQNLDGFSGGSDFPYEEFADNHLLFSLVRFDDIMERAKYLALYDSLPRKMKNFAPMKGGNSAFRVRGYLREGGHVDAIKNEHGNIRTALWQKDAFRSKRNNIYTITTSARRYVRAISSGLGISDRLENFGKKGDLAETYDVIPEEQFRFASENPWKNSFSQSIGGAMNKKYFESLRSAKDKANVQSKMKNAANHLGFEIEFVSTDSGGTDLHSEYIILKSLDKEMTKQSFMEMLEAQYAEYGTQSTKYRREKINKMKKYGNILGLQINFNDLITDKHGINFEGSMESSMIESALKAKDLPYFPSKRMKVSIDLNDDKRIIDYLERFLTGVYHRYGDRGAAELESQKARMIRTARFMGLKISFHAYKEKNNIAYVSSSDIDTINMEKPSALNERKNLVVKIDDYEGLRDYVINKFGSN